MNEGGAPEVGHLSLRGTWREGSSTADPEGYAEYGSGNGRLFP